MKKMISLVVVALMGTATFAQSQAELQKQRQEDNKLMMKVVNGKPSKDAKKEAKKYEKDGWRVPAGELSMERQFTKSQLYGEELMTNADGSIVQRFLQHTSQAQGGSYNAAYATARTSVMTEIASMIETQLAASWEKNTENMQVSAADAATGDTFKQKARAFVEQTITNTIPMVAIYRVLPNNNYEVMVRLAFDKREIAVQLKRKLQQELQTASGVAEGVVDEAMNNVQ